MKVLHLPDNIASQLSVTVRALREIGVQARGLACTTSHLWDPTGLETYLPISRRRHPLRGTWQTLRTWGAIWQAIRWADVVHWYFRHEVLPWAFDLRYIAGLGKPALVEFWGSDIRIPEIAAADNPYYAALCSADRGHKEMESRQQSLAMQAKFARFGFECLIPAGELLPFVDRRVFPQPLTTWSRVMLSDYQPRYPDPQRRRPLVVHLPSNKRAKGTDAVLAAVEGLRSRVDFEFRLIHGVPHAEAIAALAEADVMLDQFIFGGYGLATVEALAQGKPTLCYLKPAVAAALPADCPIVNANPENLAEVLSGLLCDPARRHAIGRQSRAYAEKYHDAHTVAPQLVTIYEQLLLRRQTSGLRKGRVPQS